MASDAASPDREPDLSSDDTAVDETNQTPADADRPIERAARLQQQGEACQRYCHLCLLVCGRMNQGAALNHDCRITFCPTPDDIPVCWVCIDLRLRVQMEGQRRVLHR